MATPQSPKRVTRSNSTSNISLSNIKELIVNSQRDIISTLKEKFESLESKLTLLSSRIQNIEAKMTTMGEIGKKNEKEINELKEGLFKVAKELPGELLNEVEERNFRRQNLIFSGIPKLDSGDIVDRKSHDMARVNEISKKLDVIISENFKTMRIGRPGDSKPRLLKVAFSSLEDRNELLRNGKTLRNSSSHKKVFINPDLTTLQRSNNKALRAELRRRREAGERVKIRGERIVEQSNQNFH
jgi:hypothetical protein